MGDLPGGGCGKTLVASAFPWPLGWAQMGGDGTSGVDPGANMSLCWWRTCSSWRRQFGRL